MELQELKELLKKQEIYHASCSAEEKLTLINQIIETTSKILIVEPDDHYARLQRMRMNAFPEINNVNTIIEDATFIAENERIGMKCLVGYDWLVYAYTDLLGVRDRGIEIQQEQLVCLQRLAMSRADLDFKSGELLDKLAYLQFQNNQKEQAIKSWGLAFKHYPFTHSRNVQAGNLLLEMDRLKESEPLILMYHDWCYEIEDGYQVPIASNLQRLYDKGTLDDFPLLMAVLFHLIRNNMEAFGLVQTLSFYELYIPKLEIAITAYPECSELWMAIGNTYFFDVKNYEKAYQAYLKCLQGDNPNHSYATLERIHECMHKIDKDFFKLPFSFEGTPLNLYNIVTVFTSLYDKSANEEEEYYSNDLQDADVRYLDIGLQFAENGYKEFSAYFIDGQGESIANLSHIFASTCNNYGTMIQRYNKHIHNGKYDKELSEKAYQIHMVGYNHLATSSNIENAFDCALDAELFQECVDACKLYERHFIREGDLFDHQNCYWHKLVAYTKLDQKEKVKEVYKQAKDLYLKLCQGAVDAENKFIFVSKKYFEYEILKVKNYKTIIPEIEWFLSTKITEKDEPNEVGLMEYYLGICNKNIGNKDIAIQHFQKSYDLLFDCDNEYYEDKGDLAIEQIKELGGKPLLQEKEGTKKTSAFKKLWTAIAFPFMVIALIGGFLYQATKKELENPEEK